MHINLHLTTRCNLNCDYCYTKVGAEISSVPAIDITEDIIGKAIALAMQETQADKSIGIVFFGGEPLLRKDLIRWTIEHCQEIEQKYQRKFHYKITTNGLLLDEDFLELANQHDIQIALSFDGIQAAHDLHRIINKNNRKHGTYETVKKNGLKLLKFRRYSAVMMTVNPDTVQYFSDSMKFLYELGFRKILSGLNYLADWTEQDFANLKNEYEKIAGFYLEKTLAEEKFIIGIIDNKISRLINPEQHQHSICSLGLNQVSVAPDGNIFPCVQFLSFPPENRWLIGKVHDGLDNSKRMKLFTESETEKQSCLNCEINHRCEHFCGCINKSITGTITEVAPAVCANERILIPIVDELAKQLFSQKSPMFIQKHYNEFFSVISCIEDMNEQI